MGTFSAPMPASLPQRLLLLLSGAALLGPTPLPCRQPMACSSRMPVHLQVLLSGCLFRTSCLCKACQASMLAANPPAPNASGVGCTYAEALFSLSHAQPGDCIQQIRAHLPNPPSEISHHTG